MSNPVIVTKHYKLSDVVESTLTKFDLRLRMPNWAPDIIEFKKLDNLGRPISFTQAAFVEEALAAITKDNKPDRLPFISSVSALGSKDSILGVEFSPSGSDYTKHFDAWLRILLDHFRRYNASLYRLRRIHLIAENNTSTMDPIPGDTISNDPQSPEKAEEDYVNNVNALQKALDTKIPGDKYLPIVDAIQVNGYVVSVRAVGKIHTGVPTTLADGKHHIMTPQPGGSLSSHISISGPFSSPR